MAGSESIARAITTFCWLPPESADTGASRDGAFTASVDSSRSTTSSSRRRLTKKMAVLRRSRADSAAFSRTLSPIIRPSVWRSDGM